MSRFRCASCGGEYDDRMPDGMEYYHVCPSVVLVRARTDTGQEIERPLRAYAGIELAASDAARTEAIARGADPTKVYVELARREAPRKDARDETTLRRDGPRGERRVVKAEGKGRAPIADAPRGPAPVADAP